jgi:choline dehydrogenase-like flavoprotein
MELVSWLRNPKGKPHKPEKLKGQFHHMCTTRMSDEPRTGVVDRNCRIHGLDNLYVGGSSVFSNSGVSIPTYTIVQLALRLADHIDAQLRKQ